jgi:hypothetical protein
MNSSDGNNTNRRQFLKSAVLSGVGVAAGSIAVPSALAGPVKKTLVLAKQGKSTYSILVSQSAPPSEQRAAAELQRLIEEMTGAHLPIITDAEEAKGNMVLLGDSQQLRKLGLNIPFDTLGAEGFVLRTEGKHLVIAGGKPRGTMYGVYTFLDGLGCRWFTTEVSVVPKRPTLIVKPLDESQRPAFEYREPFFAEAFDKDWAARNKVNGSSQRLDASTGGKVSYFPFVHSAYSILPPKEYFQDHPEYYAMVDGKRRGDDAQLCFTNPDVLRLTVQTVLKWIDQHPEASIISVSQNDTQGWCECENCHRVEQEEGGAHSGPILRFVNAVAAEVGKTHPDKLIDTLAYWYSEPPPSKVRPLPNVRVRLCPIGVCEAHPYERCEHDRYFLDHLRAWARITNQLYIWHYVTNFSHYLMPFPDFDELAADIPLYKNNGVVGIFLEGDGSPGGENAELRSYVMARLLWNPNVNVNEAIDEFMAAYYGQAARAMRAYFDLQHRQVRLPPQGEGHHMWIFIHPGAAYMSEDFLTQATKFLEEAESAAADEATRKRVQRARLSIDYVKMVHSKVFVVRNGIYAPDNLDQLKENFQKVVSTARSFGVAEFHEGGSLEETETAFARYIKPYQVATLENSSLRVSVVPELRGRIISIIDKATNADVVHHPDPGEHTYPDASGVAVYACADYVQAKTYDTPWQLDEPPGPEEIRLVGKCPEGLKMRRTIQLRSDQPVVHTETTVENTGNSPLDAVLSARYDVELRNLQEAMLSFRAQGGETVHKALWTPGMEPTATDWYADSAMPDGEWSLTGLGTQLAAAIAFRKDQVTRCNTSWTGKAVRRVTMSVWSAKRALAPGESLKLEADYKISKS